MSEREIPNYSPGGCFGCSTTNPYSLRLRFWYSEHGCSTRCSIPDYLCGLDGLVHGGILALLMDEVAQWTNIARLGLLGVTRNISVQYYRPMKTETEMIVESQIISHEEKSAVQQSTVHSADGTLVAESRSEWIFPRLSTIAGMASVNEATLQEFMAKYSGKEETAEQ